MGTLVAAAASAFLFPAGYRDVSASSQYFVSPGVLESTTEVVRTDC